MFYVDKPPRLGLLLVAGGAIAGSLSFSSAVYSQEVPSAKQNENAVVVTGSRIRRIQQEGPAPVVTITAEEMNRRGYNTVLEALKDLSQNSGGGIDQQNIFGFAPSASAVDLRGFGIGRALVLIDGRRVPVFPLANNGTDNFVDLTSIPAAAVEKIDVLTDGASAIYGSDAVSGVINVILKNHTDNTLSLRRTDTTQGGGGQTRAQFATGIEGSDNSRSLLFLEYYKQDVLKFTDRSFSRSDVFGDLGTFSSLGDPGTLFDPFSGASAPAANCSTSGGSPGIVGPFCRFNRAQYRELYPDEERYSLTGKYDRPFSDHLTGFGKLTYFNSTTKIQFEPTGLDMAGELGLVLTPDAPNNPTNPLVDTSGTYAGNNISGAFRRRLVEFGPRKADVGNDTFSALMGVRGTFGSDFDWESGLGYTEQRITEVDTGYARKDAFARALCGDAGPLPGGISCDAGTLNLFNPIPQSVVDQLSAQPRTHGISSMTSADLSLNGNMFALPHGPAKFAFITEFNKQSFEVAVDSDVLSGNVISRGGSPGSGQRKYYAAGVELEFPVLETLSLNLAGRYDQYDDASSVGGAFSPRFTIEYRPTKSLLVRGSAGKSFRAPDLQRLFGAQTSSFENLIDTPACVAHGGTKGVSLGLQPGMLDPCTDLVESINATAGANPNLKEESGDNFNGGIVWEAAHGLTVKADVFYLELNDIVNTPDLQTILDENAATGAFADAITRNATNVSVINNPGGLDTVSAQARNLSVERGRGVDFGGDYNLSIGGAGNLVFALSGTYLDQLVIRETIGSPLVNILRDGSITEEVRFKWNATVHWTRGPVSATAFVNYIGPFASAFPDVQPKVSSWTTLNVSGSYDLPWKGQIQLGVDNVLNRDPPLYTANGSASQPFYDQTMHNPYGASWFVNYTQKF